ncbi:hypothetical protein [Anaerococcus degeneri]|uniref:Uncharacterized protein n=1 Tax=Anaerococcus degeneri TaxID=361500 RepID=A0ABS7Z1T5_9FIRM|nr:hypothetical protein [Anaerococcus degeneri]MBP2016184.1 hypothetical protein [Anaerococcus degeneri]MCA2096612.1 hypothetical protein [Anaerococcus degeneri]
MKIKIKYDLKDVEGVGKKTYTKTFSQVNQAATKENLRNFTEAYLSLVKSNGQGVNYVIYKANEEKIDEGQLG